MPKDKPADSGDDGNWYYDPSSGGRLYLYNGGCTLKPSSESGAESALQTDLDIRKDAEFNSGTVGKRAHNEGTISDGTFQGEVFNYKTIFRRHLPREVAQLPNHLRRYLPRKDVQLRHHLRRHL